MKPVLFEPCTKIICSRSAESAGRVQFPAAKSTSVVSGRSALSGVFKAENFQGGGKAGCLFAGLYAVSCAVACCGNLYLFVLGNTANISVRCMEKKIERPLNSWKELLETVKLHRLKLSTADQHRNEELPLSGQQLTNIYLLQLIEKLIVNLEHCIMHGETRKRSLYSMQS